MNAEVVRIGKDAIKAELFYCNLVTAVPLCLLLVYSRRIKQLHQVSLILSQLGYWKLSQLKIVMNCFHVAPIVTTVRNSHTG